MTENDDTFGLPNVSSLSSRQNHGFIKICCAKFKKKNFFCTMFLHLIALTFIDRIIKLFRP